MYLFQTKNVVHSNCVKQMWIYISCISERKRRVKTERVFVNKSGLAGVSRAVLPKLCSAEHWDSARWDEVFREKTTMTVVSRNCFSKILK
jgi:hypothetical protein